MGLFEAAFVCVTKPFSLTTVAILFGLKIVGIAVWTWFQLTRSFLSFLVDLCTQAVLWSIALATLPIRVLTAVHRERMLELSLQEMQFQLEDHVHENEQLAEQLQTSMKNRKLMETLFTELEDDYEIALSTIGRLEDKVQELKDENLRLRDDQGKTERGHGRNDGKEIHSGGAPSRSSGNAVVGCTDGRRSLEPFNEALHQRRISALSQSLFSAVLSLVVGMTVWEADDPCMPLVCALFIVVGMSLSSVVQFFSTIRNRPATDAVALLSFNWFVLGALASPTLPQLARVVAPSTLEFAGRALRWIGLST